MKEHVLAVIRIQPKLERLCERVDTAMQKAAMRIGGETGKQVDEVLRLVDLKRRLVNLKIICEEMTARITESEKDLLLMAASGCPLAQIATRCGTSTSGAMRLLAKIKERCQRYLNRIGIEEYADILSRVAK